MKYYSVDGLIIKAMDYGEGHRIFTLFTKEEGKLSAIARGVKKPKSTLKGHLQLGNRCNFLLYRGKTLDTISQATAKETYSHIRENPKAYLFSSYFMELLNLALPEKEPNQEVFQLTLEVFRGLGEMEPQKVARFFEIHLLHNMGYGVDFKHCMLCGKSLKEGFLSPRFEGVICEDCGSGYPLSPQALYALDFYHRTPLLQIQRLKLDDETEKIMAKATKHMFRFHIDRKIKSLEILEEC